MSESSGSGDKSTETMKKTLGIVLPYFVLPLLISLVLYGVLLLVEKLVPFLNLHILTDENNAFQVKSLIYIPVLFFVALIVVVFMKHDLFEKTYSKTQNIVQSNMVGRMMFHPITIFTTLLMTIIVIKISDLSFLRGDNGCIKAYGFIILAVIIWLVIGIGSSGLAVIAKSSSKKKNL